MLKRILIIIVVTLSLSAQAQNNNTGNFSGDSYAEMYNFSSLTSLQSGSISFWFKINNLNQPGILFSVSNGLASPNNNEFYINYNSNVHTLQATTIVGGDVIMDAYIPYYAINNNNWHHYALIADNVGAIQIYIDGVAQTLSDGPCCGGNTNENFFGDVPSLNSMYIGALKRGSIILQCDFEIDDFMIWDKALSASEVQSIINAIPTPPVTNLVVNYTFELLENLSVGNTGTNDYRDQTGNTVHADFVGDEELEIDPGCYVEMSNISSLTSLQSGSISFWFKINNLNQAGVLFSASNGLAIPDNNEFYINYNSNVHTIQTATIVGSDVIMDAYIPYYAINDNNWHHYPLVADNAGVIQIYIDGVAQTLSDGPCCGGNTNENFFGDVPSLNNMYIGALKRGNIISQCDFGIDDLAIWDKALSASEVSTLFTSIPSSTSPNLVVYYNFDFLNDLGIGASGVNDVEDIAGSSRQHGDNTCLTITSVFNASEDYANGISLFPNPTQDWVNIEFMITGSDVLLGELTDNAGRIIMTWSSLTTEKYSTQLNLSSLPSGIYFVQITGVNTNKRVKVIKQ